MRSFIQTSILLLLVILLGFSYATENGVTGDLEVRGGHRYGDIVAALAKAEQQLKAAKKNVKTVTRQLNATTLVQTQIQTIYGQPVTETLAVTQVVPQVVTETITQVSTMMMVTSIETTVMVPTTVTQTASIAGVVTPPASVPTTLTTSVLAATPAASNAAAAVNANTPSLQSSLDLGSLATAIVIKA